MDSFTSSKFWKRFYELPTDVQVHARESYARWQEDPYHDSLQFKQVHPTRPIYSVRIGRDYRALGTKDNNEILWFWIGSHSDYDKIIANL